MAQYRARRVRLVGTLRRRCTVMSSSPSARVAAIARAFAIGPLDVLSLVERGVSGSGETRRTVRPLAIRVAAAFAGTPRPRVRDIAAFLHQDRAWLMRQLAHSSAFRWRVTDLSVTGASVMVPVDAARAWPLPSITTTAALAAWLGIDLDALSWFGTSAAISGEHVAAARHHYHYVVRPKAHDGVRVLEAPQAQLKALQRRILTEILDGIPPYFTAAHGFVKGRSVRSFAAEHVGQQVLLRIDLADFFPTVSGVRVQTVFRTLGYPEPVADALGAICTHSTPLAVFAPKRWPMIHAADLREAARLYARPHLPQGAPTSPALANLCAFRLDCRLTGLADWAGAVYSRYADDLAFSGGADVARRIAVYSAQISAIASEEGWRVQHHKTRVMRRSVQQRLTGLVVNSRVNCPRRDVDVLRATLTNCVRYGPESQNREQRPDFRAHLLGRISWVRSVNAEKAERLLRIFERIEWLA